MYGRLIAAFIIMISAPIIRADVLTYTITPAAGESSYNFTLMNTGAPQGPLFDLFLELPTDISNIDTSTIGAPLGWGDGTGGLLFFGPNANPSTSFIEWVADASGVYDLPTGASLTGFSFLSFQPILTPMFFAVNGSTTSGIAELSAVPEPATFGVVLIAVSLWSIGMHFRVARRGGRGHQPRARSVMQACRKRIGLPSRY